jgi:tripartite-type tricarboxylate transporter receptor subunit TctC
VEKYIKQPMVIISKTGGAGAIGFRDGMTAKPDGYTITVLTTSLGCAPHAIKDYPVTYKSYDPLIRIITYQETLVVSVSAPYKTVEQFIQFAKANPGKVRVGEAGYGSNHHFAAANFGKVLGLEFTMVPYAGSAETTAAVMGGHLDASFVPATDAAPLVKAGKLAALLTIDPKRAMILPNVPCLKDVKIGNPWAPTGWIGFGLPRKSPSDVRQILYNAFKQASVDKELIESVRRYGLEIDAIGLDEFGKWMKEFDNNVAEIARKINLKMK